MFQHEFEKRPSSASSCSSKATMTTDWSRGYPKDQAYPIATSYPKEYSVATGYPKEYPVATSYPKDYIIGTAYPKDHAGGTTYPKDHPVATSYPKDYTVGTSYPKEYPVATSYPKDYTIGTSYPIDHACGTTYPKDYPVVTSYPKDSYASGTPSYTSTPRVRPSEEKARRPLPPRPVLRERITLPTKTTVPLKVWVIASASCFAVCAALVVATVALTRWGTDYSRELYQAAAAEPIYAKPYPEPRIPDTTPETDTTTPSDLEDDLENPVLQKLNMFKNVVGNRKKLQNLDSDVDDNINEEPVTQKKDNIDVEIDNKKAEKTLISKPQIHPIHDDHLFHAQKKIEKKDHAKYPAFRHTSRQNEEVKTRNVLTAQMKTQFTANDVNDNLLPNLDVQTQLSITNNVKRNDKVPDFKPTLPDVIKMMDGYVKRKHEIDYEEYYNDENLYDDYMQSNTMTSYLIEKVQELHEWINTDSDFQGRNSTKTKRNGTEFTQLLTALNASLVEGNVTIIMNKLKDLYFGDNYTLGNHSRKVIVTNSTDLLSFGILSLDVMLLHNIQLMAWENQETSRIKMLKDPDVFAFNALFLEPSQIEAKQNEIDDHEAASNSKRPSSRHEPPSDYYEFGKSLLENILEVGMSTARAAIHLGRAYKNTKIILTQLSNRETVNANMQLQLSRNSDANGLALQHLQSSFGYTELDCVWLLYCRSLAATARLPPPYGAMARINGVALRMLTGELPPEKALDTMLYEALTGWTELRCDSMFPRCSKVNAANVVLDSILPKSLKKAQSTNRSVI